MHSFEYNRVRVPYTTVLHRELLCFKTSQLFIGKLPSLKSQVCNQVYRFVVKTISVDNISKLCRDVVCQNEDLIVIYCIYFTVNY